MCGGPFYDGDKPFGGELKDAFDRANLFIWHSGMVHNYGLFGYDWPRPNSRNADEAMSVYARAHSMFGIEPHSLIMALEVPVIHALARAQRLDVPRY